MNTPKHFINYTSQNHIIVIKHIPICNSLILLTSQIPSRFGNDNTHTQNNIRKKRKMITIIYTIFKQAKGSPEFGDSKSSVQRLHLNMYETYLLKNALGDSHDNLYKCTSACIK